MQRPSHATRFGWLKFAVAVLFTSSCVSSAPEGLAPAAPAATTVRFDFYHKPLPEIPLPNDIATRFDETSPTKRRVNASMVAPSRLQRRVREKIDQLDGWGAFQPISIPFTGPLDVNSILQAHRDPHYGLADDVVYLINVDPKSKHFKQIHHLDVGNGNYPVVLRKLDNYWKNDPRGDTISIPFEEHNEDLNGNGKLDMGGDLNGNGVIDPGEEPEDTDADGLLDVANYLPGANPPRDNLAARADALMTFYDRASNTLLVRPMEPLDERTTYAVVVTRRLKDANGQPVGSPFPFINHTAQTKALAALPDALPTGLKMEDVAFAFSFTTQSEQSVFQAVRDGLYGHGVQQHFATEFPAELKALMPMRDDDKFPNMTNAHVVYAEQWLPALSEIVVSLTGAKKDSESYKAALESQQYIDYIVIGSYESPQLFDRYDADGNWMNLDDQSWPPDITEKKAKTRRETIYFTLTVPRKEISERGKGKPAPVVIAGHGYGSNRFEGLQLAGFFAKFGFATFTIDGPSHGIGLSQLQKDLALGIFERHGLRAAGEAILSDRTYNQDNDPDGTVDSAADFWTSYLFHTRDVVRQYVLDIMQGIRIMRTFDGTQRWKFDVNGSGSKGLAGDFDGDGVVDIDGPGKMGMMGGSLGGIMSMLMGSLEPQISRVTPISGGGGFSDMGVRTAQGGAVEGFVLRGMGPLYVGTLNGEGKLVLETIIPDLNSTGTRLLAEISDVKLKAWDTMVVENLVSGKRGCGYIAPNGTVRGAVESDKGDLTRISFYSGPQLTGDTECTVRDGVKPVRVVNTFEKEVSFQWDKNRNPVKFAVGEPLVSLADGFGLRRAHPDLRRFMGLGQLVLDAADPAVFARHLLKDPLVYPGTGEKTGCHAIVVTTMGDNAVPANSGVAYGRAAGLIDYLNDDPRYGKPANQVLIDNYVVEAQCRYKRFTKPNGDSLCEDVENLSGGADRWGSDVPRLDPPLRLGADKKDALNGVSVALFPFPQPDGQHGFDLPGDMTDSVRKDAQCGPTCDSNAPANNPCSCDAKIFDIGYFMLNMLGEYLASGGTVMKTEACQAQDTCPGKAPVPTTRSGSAIDAQ
jgi:hypothetical protein